MMFVTAQDEAVASLPAIRIDGGLGKHLALDDRLQLCLGAVWDHAGEDPAAAFEKPHDGRLAAGSAPALAPHAPWAEIGFINLDLPGEGLGFSHRQLHRSPPQQLINPLAGLAIDHRQLSRRQCRNIRPKQLHQLLEFPLRNPCIANISVSY